jgi:hypothetical protein
VVVGTAALAVVVRVVLVHRLRRRTAEQPVSLQAPPTDRLDAASPGEEGRERSGT